MPRQTDKPLCGTRKGPYGTQTPPPVARHTTMAAKIQHEALIIAKRLLIATETPPFVETPHGTAEAWDGSAETRPQTDDNKARFLKNQGLSAICFLRIFAKFIHRAGRNITTKTTNGKRKRTTRGTPCAAHGNPSKVKSQQSLTLATSQRLRRSFRRFINIFP